MEARTDSRTHGADVLSWEDQDSEMSWMLQASSEKAQQEAMGGKRLGQAHGYLSPKGCQEVLGSQDQFRRSWNPRQGGKDATGSGRKLGRHPGLGGTPWHREAGFLGTELEDSV